MERAIAQLLGERLKQKHGYRVINFQTRSRRCFKPKLVPSWKSLNKVSECRWNQKMEITRNKLISKADEDGKM